MKVSETILGAIFWTLAVVMLTGNAQAFEKEDFYNKKYCAEMGGTFNKFHRHDTGRSFVDCETETTVWEGEWSSKPYEAVGQSLYYATVTGKTPGILFYVKDEKTRAKTERAIWTLDNLGIDYEMEIITVKEK